MPRAKLSTEWWRRHIALRNCTRRRAVIKGDEAVEDSARKRSSLARAGHDGEVDARSILTVGVTKQIARMHVGVEET